MNCALNNTRKPDITFHANGRIDITARVAKVLSLRPGDVIDIAHDGNEYFLYCRHHNAIGRHEAQCQVTNYGKTCNNLRAHSKRLCNAVLNVNGNTNEARLPVGEPIAHEDLGTILPIIIKRNIPR